MAQLLRPERPSAQRWIPAGTLQSSVHQRHVVPYGAGIQNIQGYALLVGNEGHYRLDRDHHLPRFVPMVQAGRCIQLSLLVPSVQSRQAVKEGIRHEALV